MTQPISRRTVAKAGVWSAPVVAASAAVPAYAASKETPGVQYGVYVSVQNNGGYVGYASSNNTGTINPATPEAHFTASGTPDSDINWDDATSKPKSATYVNGEGKFTPVTNSQTGANGATCPPAASGGPYRPRTPQPAPATSPAAASPSRRARPS